MITVLFGANRLALQQRLAALKKQFTDQYSEAGVEEVSAERIQPEQLATLLSGVSLFAPQRLVVIKNLVQSNALAERFMELIASTSVETQVLLVEQQLDKRTTLYKLLKKLATLEEFTELDETTAAEWAGSFAKNEGGRLDSRTARYLVAHVGSNQLQLKNELEKLIAYDPNITQATIDELVEKTPQESVFLLLELAFGGQKKAALELLDSMERAHDDPFQLVSMLIWQTHILAVVASAENTADAQIAKDAKLSPYVVQKTRALVRRLSRSQLKQIIDVIIACDTNLKTSSAEPWRVLEQALIQLVTVR